MPSDLHSLAARAEAAEGPDRELDHSIATAMGWRKVPNPSSAGGLVGRWYRADGTLTDHFGVPHFTASIDAALMLVPEGWQVAALEQNWRTGLWRAQLIPVPSATLIAAFDRGETVGWNTADAPDSGTGGIVTPALALAAASLKARATQGENYHA
jgi:hypothetical protein